MNYGEILREYGVQASFEDGKAKVHCPFHDDQNPSAVIFLSSGVMHCTVCDLSVNFYRYMARKLGRDVYHELNQKFNPALDKVIAPNTIEMAHGRIFEEKFAFLLEELNRRGISEDLIRKYRLGVLKDRVSIPIKNESGFFVNLRLYKPGAATQKVLNFKKHGKPARFFPVDQLQYDRIVLHGGEMKAISVEEELNKNEIGSISSTHGEGSLPIELIGKLAGKTVYICMDIDDAGKNAAAKHALALMNTCDWVGILDLPLSEEKYPKGDVNDYLLEHTPIDFHNLLKDVPEFIYEQDSPYLKYEDPVDTTLTKAVHADQTYTRVRLKSVVSTLDLVPYTLPKTVTIVCDRSEKCCSLCPVSNLLPTEQTLTIPAESPALIKMAGQKDKDKKIACMEALGIPSMCRKCSFVDIDSYNVEEAKISEELDLQSTLIERSMQTAFCIGDALELNETYEMTGRMVPNPHSQQAALIISDYKATEDALSKFQCTKYEELSIFQPEDWTVAGLQKKLGSIYEDFEAHITRIFERRDLHLAYDLAYHSPLWMKFDGRPVKAWVEILVVGDTACGKSSVICSPDGQYGLMPHYNLGERLDCKGATRAGLLGGQDRIGGRWIISWGKIPINDRRLVILEEFNGTSTEVISKLTDMRSSGFAEITGITRRRTHARTRVIAIANPRSQRQISGFNYGIDAVREVVGANQDIRRFDLSLVVAREEVDIGKFDEYRPVIPQVYTADLCRELVLWCWTVDHAEFENERLVLSSARKLCEKFTDEIPIVDRGSMREKLARLSAALAGRTFSTKNQKTIFVRDCHVDYMYSYLDSIYSRRTTGYADYSEKLRSSEEMVKPERVEQRLSSTKDSDIFIEHLLLADDVDRMFVQDTLGVHPDDAGDLLSFLIRSRCLKRDGKVYRKTQSFTEFLKQISEKGMKDPRPEFMGKNQFD